MRLFGRRQEREQRPKSGTERCMIEIMASGVYRAQIQRFGCYEYDGWSWADSGRCELFGRREDAEEWWRDHVEGTTVVATEVLS